jgi:Uma2 family endonuclease
MAVPEGVMSVATRLGPGDHGRAMSLDEFTDAAGQPGFLYELARGVVEVIHVPELSHGSLVDAINDRLAVWRRDHPGVIHYKATGSECKLRLPGMQSERHPDLSVYLTPPPDPISPWDRWVPDIVIEVVSEGGEKRDYEDKRHEYLAAGVREYWIVDASKRLVLVLERVGDVFRERVVSDLLATPLLPGFALRLAELMG